MSVAEMKIEVIKKISNLNDESVLKEVLALLQEGNENPQDSLNLSRTYDAVKKQYGDVLQKTCSMILVDDILELHIKSIEDFGGLDGIRDLGLLESAIARPFQTFGGADLYPTVFEKAAALGESLIINHPFIDGNKRTGMLAMAGLLIDSNFYFTATSNDFYNFIINISTGSLSFEEIVEWLKNNTKAK